MTDLDRIQTAVRHRYQGYRLIKTPISLEKLKAVKNLSSKIVTIEQVNTYAKEKATEIGFTGDIEITMGSL